MPVESPYWWIEAPLDDAPAAVPNEYSDAVIVGGGYTGLAAAIELARAGRSVQIFDAMWPGEGASTRNGGIASGNLRHSLTSAIKAYGQEAGIALFREGQAARADLAAFVDQDNIDCDYQASGRFTGAINRSQLEFQKREAELIVNHLGVNAHVVGNQTVADEIGTDYYVGGMVREDLASLHPAKLHAGMLSVAKSAGAGVFGRMPVTDYVRNGKVFDVCVGGRKIRAKNLIVATNGYSGRSDPWLRRRLVPVTSRIVVTGEIPVELMDRLLPKRRAMGEMSNMFRYYRPTPDGKRILLGAREKMFSASATENATHVFRELLKIFPEVEPFGFEYSWNGNVAFNRDEMPGLFEKDGVIYACGYCGSGVVWARWIGMKAAKKVLGDPDAKSAFDGTAPPAIPFYRGKPWFLPAFMGYYYWQDRRAEQAEKK